MKVDVFRNEATVYIRVTGRVVLDECESFKSQTVPHIVPGVARLHVDLSQVEFIDSAGLGVLVGLKMTANKSKAKLAILSPSQGVADILYISKLDGIFEIITGTPAEVLRQELCQREFAVTAAMGSGGLSANAGPRTASPTGMNVPRTGTQPGLTPIYTPPPTYPPQAPQRPVPQHGGHALQPPPPPPPGQIRPMPTPRPMGAPSSTPGMITPMTRSTGAAHIPPPPPTAPNRPMPAQESERQVSDMIGAPDDDSLFGGIIGDPEAEGLPSLMDDPSDASGNLGEFGDLGLLDELASYGEDLHDVPLSMAAPLGEASSASPKAGLQEAPIDDAPFAGADLSDDSLEAPPSHDLGDDEPFEINFEGDGPEIPWEFESDRGGLEASVVPIENLSIDETIALVGEEVKEEQAQAEANVNAASLETAAPSPNQFLEKHCANAFEFMRQGDYDRSILEYKKALDLDPHYLPALNNLAIVYEKKPSWHKQAVEQWEHVLTISRSNGDQKHIERAQKHIASLSKLNT